MNTKQSRTEVGVWFESCLTDTSGRLYHPVCYQAGRLCKLRQRGERLHLT